MSANSLGTTEQIFTFSFNNYFEHLFIISRAPMESCNDDYSSFYNYCRKIRMTIYKTINYYVEESSHLYYSGFCDIFL